MKSTNLTPDPITGWMPGLCPGCSGSPSPDPVVRGRITIADARTCSACGGIFTVSPIGVGEAFLVVRPQWCACDGDQLNEGNAFYFDLDIRQSHGDERTHGFACSTCHRLVQVG